ncbi:hypothetical protein TNCT_579441 [Trichonephila clavata]|uniref:Uncharacterized protein n=1 Tax=Trichonephila clavata TaxID=2740835 RepID=A0A8X6K572_TRICU|nr:hypothetical protein TNCT_579441 [Trichonephila clavata]
MKRRWLEEKKASHSKSIRVDRGIVQMIQIGEQAFQGTPVLFCTSLPFDHSLIKKNLGRDLSSFMSVTSGNGGKTLVKGY